MKQTTLGQDGNSLLRYAISTLSPVVFSHPVWVRFGKKDMASTPGIIDDLLSAARNIQEDDPRTACQILLICAVFQNCRGQSFKALQTTRRALALADQRSLVKEALWAIWGACAISVQQGNYEQAVESLVDLKAALSQQNEWILADFEEVLRQSFFQQDTVSNERQHGPSGDRWSGDMLDFTLEWLRHWGVLAETFEPEFGLASEDPANHPAQQSALTQSFFSIQRLQGRWHTLMLAIRGELRLKWIENDQRSAKRRFSFWGSFLSSLRLYFFGQRADPQAKEEKVPQLAGVSVLPPPQKSPHAFTKAQKKKSVSKVNKPRKKKVSAQALTTTPVAVHMLGAFRLTIGDLTVKLPASRGLSLLKYLLLHHRQSVSRDVLIDVFWPDAEPETARNSLNVAVHSLRKALRNIIFLPVITFQDGAYGLEPNLQVWLDVEEFERCVKAGQRLEARDQLSAAVTEHETAISLYQGDFLEQNLYDEWTVLERERLRIAYLDTLDRLSQIYFRQERYAACITVCQLILSRDRCREDAHYLLMRCFSRQGQYHLALRQYQICVESLRVELDVEPAPETKQLCERIRRRDYD